MHFLVRERKQLDRPCMDRSRVLRGGSLRLLFVATLCFSEASGFHMWWDGSTVFGTWHPPGSTEECPLKCSSGFGCTIDAQNRTVCTACRKDEASPNESTSCHSCKYGDQSACTYNVYLRLLTPPLHLNATLSALSHRVASTHTHTHTQGATGAQRSKCTSHLQLIAADVK